LYPVAVLALLLALAGWLVEQHRQPPPPRTMRTITA
jgi:apolipoprotein N-acyltransferase